MLESKVEKDCIKYAKSQGYDTRKVKFIGSNGAPDRIFFKPGRFIWVELKTKGGILSKLQEYQIDVLRKAGQEVYVVWDLDEFKEIIC